jgi:heme-degrading monooxygenase HmoA
MREQPQLARDSHLEKVPGFVEFHLLKGPEAEDHTLSWSKEQKLGEHPYAVLNQLTEQLARTSRFCSE